MKVKNAGLSIHGMKDTFKMKVNYGCFKLLSFLTMIPTMLVNKITASADELDFLKNPASDGAFSSLNDTVKETGGSLYTVVRNIGFVILMIGIIVIGMGISVNKNSQRRDEHKTQLLWYIIGAIVFFGGFTILAMAKKIAGGIDVK